MKEKPILFSTPMVQAILDGRKTQTRRIVKNIPSVCYSVSVSEDGTYLRGVSDNGSALWIIECPSKIGDILWVRETWWHNRETWGDSEVFLYKADFPIDGYDHVDAYKWKPSIFMPKDACRLKLRVTDISVERLQCIDESEALAEGITSFTKDGVGFKFGLDGWNWSYRDKSPFMCSNAVLAYSELWESINGSGAWDKNPWVWVITFERINNH